MATDKTYYKIARPDGWDFFSGKTINYREALQTGQLIYPKQKGEVRLCSPTVLHACDIAEQCFVGGTVPCSLFRVTGQPAVSDNIKHGFTELTVIEELDPAQHFKWRYSEAANPVNPLRIVAPEIIPAIEALVSQWASIRCLVRDSLRDLVVESVGDSVGASVRDSVRDSVEDSVWDSVWESVWKSVWDSVRDSVEDSVWKSVWESVRDSVGDSVWESVWESVRDSVGDSVRDSVEDSVWKSVWESVRDSVGDLVWDSVGDLVWAYIGWIFAPVVKAWKYIEHEPGQYPFQPAVDLWKMGLVPVFDGTIWRLCGGKQASILWEGKL